VSEADELDDFLRGVSPDIPADAADRVLGKLGPDTVHRCLFWAELDCTARLALVLSTLLALVGLALVVRTCHRAPAHAIHREGPEPVFAEASGALREARRLAHPFTVEEKK
jgi:hypothetical protein